MNNDRERARTDEITRTMAIKSERVTWEGLGYMSVNRNVNQLSGVSRWNWTRVYTYCQVNVLTLYREA
jgi:hypothetical protein